MPKQQSKVPGVTDRKQPGALATPSNREAADGSGEKPDNLKRLAGSQSLLLNSTLVNQAAHALWYPPSWTLEDRQRLQSSAVDAMFEFRPRDAIEGMMAAQAVAAHAAAMECYRRAMIPDQSGEAAHALRKNAASMTRTFVELIDAMDRKRGGTRQQVVRVERVQVAPGGQAIVGNVTAGVGGRTREGVGRESE